MHDRNNQRRNKPSPPRPPFSRCCTKVVHHACTPFRAGGGHAVSVIASMQRRFAPPDSHRLPASPHEQSTSLHAAQASAQRSRPKKTPAPAHTSRNAPGQQAATTRCICTHCTAAGSQVAAMAPGSTKLSRIKLASCRASQPAQRCRPGFAAAILTPNQTGQDSLQDLRCRQQPTLKTLSRPRKLNPASATTPPLPSVEIRYTQI